MDNRIRRHLESVKAEREKDMQFKAIFHQLHGVWPNKTQLQILKQRYEYPKQYEMKALQKVRAV